MVPTVYRCALRLESAASIMGARMDDKDEARGIVYGMEP
jgi:hypothetical protein